MKFILLIIIITLIECQAQNRWEKLNGPVGASIQSMLVIGDTIVAGTGWDHALIFYSTDRGRSWQRGNVKSTGTFSSFVTTADGGIIAASWPEGLFKSFDLKNWPNIYNDENDFVDLGKDFENNIYAGTRNFNISNKIFISTNNGGSWDISLDNYFNINNFLLFEDSTLLAGGNKDILKKESGSASWSFINLDTINSNNYSIFSDTSGNIYAFNAGTRMIVSSDTGNTWKYLDTLGFLHFGNQMEACIFNNRLIGGLNWTGLHYALGVIVSDDGGYTWRESNAGLPPEISSINCFAKSGNVTYAGTSAAGVFKSSDYGESWSPMNNGLTAAHTRDLCFGPDGILYSANWSNGFQNSTDNGETWTVINNGLTTVECYSIISDDNGILFGGTRGGGIFYSTNRGENWMKVTGNAGNNFAYKFYKDDLNRIYALTYGSGVYRTSNLGQNWQRIDNFASGYTFGLTSDSTGLMLAGTRGSRIYRSTDYGNTWTQVYFNNTLNSVIGEITGINGNYVFATNHFVGILRSTDKGISWHLVKEDTEYQFVLTAAINNEGVYASGSGGKLYFSADKGDTWNDKTDNIQRALFYRIIVDKNDRVYLATDESVWRRSSFPVPVELLSFTAGVNQNNITLNWETAAEKNNKGFEVERKTGTSWVTISFIEVKATTTEKQTYSFTDKDLEPGRYTYRLKQIDYDGTYEYSNEIEADISIPLEFVLHQNYPNPFNSSTKISYTLKDEGYVKLYIYDIKGELISTLVNKKQQSGNYEVDFTLPGNISTGVYIYRLTVTDNNSTPVFSDVKKMIYLK